MAFPKCIIWSDAGCSVRKAGNADPAFLGKDASFGPDDLKVMGQAFTQALSTRVILSMLVRAYRTVRVSLVIHCPSAQTPDYFENSVNVCILPAAAQVLRGHSGQAVQNVVMPL